MSKAVLLLEPDILVLVARCKSVELLSNEAAMEISEDRGNDGGGQLRLNVSKTEAAAVSFTNACCLEL